MARFLRVSAIFLLSLVMATAAFTGGVIYDQRVVQANVQKVSVPPGTAADFKLLVDAWQTIRQNYVDQPTAQDNTLAYGAISGMVDALGDTGHSRFMSPAMVKDQESFDAGQFEGIGAEVDTQNGQIVIVTPLEGSPAQKAGVLPGDIILKVDGTDVSGLPLYTVVGRILGPAGTQVKITLQTPSTGAVRELTITRAVIKMNAVSWSMVPGTQVADVRLAAFSNGATNSLQSALKSIQAQGATALILDLRDNPGGLLDEAVGVASQFMKSGTVLQEKDAKGKVDLVPVKQGGLATSIPMVVLINQGTASGAEIVAGALQDAGRARLIGETTFGTGTVLNQFALPDQSALLLATQEWLTPNGRLIWHHGITPDDIVALPAGASVVAPEVLKTLSADRVKTSADAQFLQALKDLHI